MKLALIGVGQAGEKVLDAFLAYDARTGADIVRGAIALLGGVTNVPRVKELQQVAIEAQQIIGEITHDSDTRLETLLDSDGELESLF